MKKLLTIGVLTASCGFIVATGQQPVPAVYTEQQAAAGRTAYESSCGKCHTDKLTGRTGAAGELPPVSSLPANMQDVVSAAGGKVPPLIGASFMAKWGTTQDLARRVNEAVGGFPPKDTDAETYLNLTAYFLQASGAQAGSQALTRTTAVELRSLKMAK